MEEEAHQEVAGDHPQCHFLPLLCQKWMQGLCTVSVSHRLEEVVGEAEGPRVEVVLRALQICEEEKKE